MTEIEIREAVVLVIRSHLYATRYKGTKEDEALQTLLALAEEYLKIEGWPEEKKYNCNPYDAPIVDVNYQGYIRGFNEALRLCKLVAMKEKIGMKESRKEA